MEIKIEKSENYTVLNLIGRLDTNTAGILENKLTELFDNNEKFIILNFKDLDYLSSAGLRVLLAAQKRIKSINGDMILKNENNDVMEVFSITGFTEILKIK